jgi:acyl dehydratase
MTLTAVATIVAIRACPPGALMLKRIDTRDAVNGELVCRTWQSTLYRGVAVAGGDRIAAEAAPALPAWSASAASVIWPLPIPAGAAHVYTECARIWNPIHTDLAQARAAGLDAIILHGTATLARAVTALLARLPDGDPARIARVACRFSGMVSVPDTLTLRMAETADNVLQFEIQDARGRNVISRGRVVCRTPG